MDLSINVEHLSISPHMYDSSYLSQTINENSADATFSAAPNFPRAQLWVMGLQQSDGARLGGTDLSK